MTDCGSGVLTEVAVAAMDCPIGSIVISIALGSIFLNNMGNPCNDGSYRAVTLVMKESCFVGSQIPA